MRHATKPRRRWALAVAWCALWTMGASPPPPSGPENATTELETLKRQVEEQEQQLARQRLLLETLKKQVGDLNAGPVSRPVPEDLPAMPPPDPDAVRQLVTDELRRREEASRAQGLAAAEQGYKVGSDLGMSVHWNVLNGVTFETPNRDFWSHLGFWFEYDNVAFTQSKSLNSPSQIGDLQDGAFFRRLRPEWEGGAWEVVEWDVILALEQISNDVPQLNEVWAGLTQLPVVGSVRIGKMRLPQGLEAGTYTGNRSATFMEVSASGQAFYQFLAPGVWASNSILDQRVTWETMVHRQDNVAGGSDSGQNGVSFGDGKYGFAGRLTALPLYENDGRCLLHLGLSCGWRKAEDVPATSGQGGTVGPTFVDYRSRPLLRDGIGDFGTDAASGIGAGLPGNQKQFVDTGLITAASSSILGTELLYIHGPFSVQAEYTLASANDASFPNAAGHLTHIATPWFDGGYLQLSYFLTGENRRYDRRYGRLSRNAIGSPFVPFWFTEGEDGRWLFGRGAWELAARYNHLDLNSGPILGGQTDAYEMGVNWYLNANLKIMFEYLHQVRYGKGTSSGGTLPGDIDGLGIRTQLMF